MAGTFETYQNKAGKHYFRLKAGNGEVILTSQGYASAAGCKNGIESVRKNATSVKNFEKTTTRNGKPRFNLRAANRKIIGTSETYNSTAARDNGIKSVKSNAPNAPVKKL